MSLTALSLKILLNSFFPGSLNNAFLAKNTPQQSLIYLNIQNI